MLEFLIECVELSGASLGGQLRSIRLWEARKDNGLGYIGMTVILWLISTGGVSVY